MRISSASLLLSLCLVAAACQSDDSVAVTATPSAPIPTVDAPSQPSPTTATSSTTPTADEPTATPTEVPDEPEEVVAAPAREPDDLAVALEPVMTATLPVDLTPRRGTETIYVAEQDGRLLAMSGGEGAWEQLAVALDLTGRVSRSNEQGLLGAVFSPDGSRLYVDFTDLDGTTTIAEYQMAGEVADPASERIVLTVAQPRPNHNGGDLNFGPDGYLYITLGDGGGAGDPDGNGQNPDTLLGSILRIDPLASGESSYAVPADNPYASGGGRPEIFLIGVRNPWRISFDRATGDLWVADVGQDAVEEVTVLRAEDGAGLGMNLGWNLLEGSQRFTGTAPSDYVGPIYQYGREDGCSVTGGYVYRGEAVPTLTGLYVFADYCTGALWALVDGGPDIAQRIDLGLRAGLVSSFGQDLDGELYVLDHQSGTVSRLVAV